MRILLDESLPRDLGREITGHEVTTVQQAGWAGLENGELLRRAAERFEVLVTGDQNIEYQQNPTLRIEALRPLIPELVQALTRIRGREFVRVSTAKR